MVDFIDAYQQQHGGVSPSFDEMKYGIGLGNKSKGRIYEMLRCLEERGIIRRLKFKTRAIEGLRPGKGPLKKNPLP